MALRDLCVLIAICLVWAGNSVMAKVLLSQFGVPPLFYAAGRFVVVVIATLPWLLPAPRPLWRMIVVGILMGGGSFALSFLGLQTATPSDFAVVSQIGVPASSLLSVVMLGERIRWRRALGIALALSGVLIVMWNPAGLTPSPGMLYIAGSAITPALAPS